ncbi:related to CBP3 - required for assembly of cytochrome bc1 complex [Cephalotrichum gorgonifer]|uniref:Related to CBP3 - required for assembly of cytochrome bc1 complex n=1 Tax=Cephalotrichum gorgonifer TaxID=2041049 RepID=A0AAE8MVJ6_9PEZI|nr:related to CBP3 - required for assembly of cytochrome bc1 complex [Cephalotrichum gorgonifer]
MACSRCSAHARLLRAASRPTAQFRQPARLASASTPTTRASFQIRAQSSQAGSSPAKPSPIASKAINSAAKKGSDGSGLVGSYAIYGGTHQIYKSVASPAAYSISAVDRENGTLETLEGGEEVGVSEGPWHELLDLPPTFSTWSQVTMLRMYILVARARCLEPEAYKSWYRQLLDHFFFDCERLMDVNHGMTSSAARQRFLKDLFVQWRGLLAAYDEGLAKGDAVLASAVWRNLYKGRVEGVDFKKVAGVVSYIRASLWDLERRSDADIVIGKDLFKKSLEGQLRGVDMQIAAVKDCA